MCGLGGLVVYPKERSKIEIEMIQYLTTINLQENQARGRDAAGIAVFNHDKTHGVLKDGVSPKSMTKSEKYWEFLDRMITPDTANILVHARAATSGTPRHNYNNHPLITGNIIGVHNGVITNDDRLFQTFSFRRDGRVDSEVIFRLIQRWGTDMKEVKDACEMLSGSFTFACVDREKPEEMVIVRNDNPLTLCYIRPLKAMIFSSVRKFIENAIIGACQNTFGDSDMIDLIRDCEWVTPPVSTIWKFNTNHDPLEDLKQKPVDFTPLYYGRQAGRSWWEHEFYKDSDNPFATRGGGKKSKKKDRVKRDPDKQEAGSLEGFVVKY